MNELRQRHLQRAGVGLAFLLATATGMAGAWLLTLLAHGGL